MSNVNDRAESLVSLMKDFVGKRRILDLLEVLDKEREVYLAQLMTMGWNAMTITTSFRLLLKYDLVTCTVRGGFGENVKKIYRLTPKGSKVLEHLREIQKLLNGRLGNK